MAEENTTNNESADDSPKIEVPQRKKIRPDHQMPPRYLRLASAPEEVRDPVTADDLLAPGAIERLITDERIPHELSVNSGRTRFQDPHASLIAIPPPGTLPEDEALIEGAKHPRVSYWRPDGQLRGYANIISATIQQAETIKKMKENIFAHLQNTPK